MSKSTILKVFISIISLIIAVILLIYISDKIIINTNEIPKVQQECEHDWVVTSEYNFIFNSYKTISKCSKCGKKV